MAAASLALIVGAIVLSQGDCHPRVGSRRNVGIFGGHQIPIEWAPYMAALQRRSGNDWTEICGASIVHERFLLTAAHCVYDSEVDEHRAVVGTEPTSGEGGDAYHIEEFIVHSNYSRADGDNFDIALVKLKKSLNFGPKVGKIYLATPSLNIAPGTELNITGWGYTDSYTDPPSLLQVQVPAADDELCEQVSELLHFEMTENVICAGTTGQDTCQGDSGGPLSLGELQVGITSQGLACGVATGVYTRVASFFDWIVKNIYDNE